MVAMQYVQLARQPWEIGMIPSTEVSGSRHSYSLSTAPGRRRLTSSTREGGTSVALGTAPRTVAD